MRSHKNKKIFDKNNQAIKPEPGLETDMKKISNEYVSDMLDKIETESKTVPGQTQTAEEEAKVGKKHAKKKKRKE